ncbi:GH92 family glycosyl hydrolase [Dysgonomonas sp. 25]|uniref:GH92 family glycosyl hydrolase n=1 Tax=Dysgonomonas sp. 25 TaxID=2302933 RepID=UPI0013D8A187|nr:GH92 family glycosyl hydrolase [Dysgonomonas sp. 25]NDV67984.1 glycoside hydrolase family 92 protein [Dysgonomonas sp. 25]
MGISKKIKLVFAIACLFFIAGKSVASNIDYASKVNTLIGTKGSGWASGYLYPGATHPFGMVQFTPSYFSKQSGFVINQLSGAGCDHMGNFPTFPLNGELTVSPDSIINLRVNVSDEKGSAGYYEATVQNNIKARLTVTERTGMASYLFSQDETTGTIIIGGGVAATDISQAAIVITSPNSCEGYADGGFFCGIPTPYKVYFVAEFDADATYRGTWKDGRLMPNTTFSEGRHSGVFFTFDVSKKKTIQYKIGVSYVSVENARQNLKAENAGWDFEATKNETVARWNHYLGKIEVEGDNPDRITQFYTHLYRTMIHPNVCSDVNGEYMGADGRIYKTESKYYTSFSNWDTYRTQTQLIAMLAPDVMSDIVVSHQLFAHQSGGAFPRWVMANIETGVMQGDPTPILISNAYAFGARNYDPRSILKVMKYSAEVPGAKSQDIIARPGLQQYMEKGYYNASIQLEYTSADFAIAQFALKACNDEPVSWYYFHRARSWKNLYNPETTWLQSRYEDGSWKPLTEDFRESTYKNYFWMVPYDLNGLIEIIGGKEVAEKRLDDLFRRLDASYNDDWFASGNEPSFQIPWIYNWVGRPDKTQNIVNRVLNEQYFNKIDGLPGNDDLGSMGAWYVFACVGLFPEIPGVGGFSLNSPIFSSVKIHLPEGDVVIKGGSEKNIYIKSLNLNGKPYESTWISWDDLSRGATLNYTLVNKPDRKWGTKIAPPSFE